MSREQDILRLIQVIRESFGSSIAVYTYGNCYQFYQILKVVFPEAEAYESGGHVYTKIDGDFYDIRGKLIKELDLIPVVDDNRISELSTNRWPDERRAKLKMDTINKIPPGNI